jgi:hypothetical protein
LNDASHSFFPTGRKEHEPSTPAPTYREKALENRKGGEYSLSRDAEIASETIEASTLRRRRGARVTRITFEETILAAG